MPFCLRVACVKEKWQNPPPPVAFWKHWENCDEDSRALSKVTFVKPCLPEMSENSGNWAGNYFLYSLRDFTPFSFLALLMKRGRRYETNSWDVVSDLLCSNLRKDFIHMVIRYLLWRLIWPISSQACGWNWDLVEQNIYCFLSSELLKATPHTLHSLYQHASVPWY